jgi:hypothetical protein
MTALDPRSNRGIVATRRKRVLASLVTLLWLGAAMAQELQVIELRHRLADDVVAALQPLVEPGGSITGMDSMLFVRTSPANLEQIRQAVAVLDRQPRQLLITVGQGTVATDAQAGVRGSATVGNDDVQVGVNRPPVGDPGGSLQARQGARRADLRNVSSTRTLEGAETFIAVGQSAPLTTMQPAPGWARPGMVQTTEYRDVSTGFYATARLSGDGVTLQISPQQQRWRGPPSDRRVETAGIATQVGGQLGEWIPVGGSSESSRRDSSGPLTWGTRSSDSQYSVWVKVEEVQ